LHGLRIDPLEVEAALMEHAGVAEAAVVVREDRPGDRRLVAYLVPRSGAVPSAPQLREHLRGRLPEFMVPSGFVTLARLPLTSNGKLDPSALPAPEASRPDQAAAFVAPRTPTEEVLAAIWADVLQIDRVGVDDNFFDLGGHSLLATRVIARVRGAFAADVPLRALFDEPTVAGLAVAVLERLLADAGPDALATLLGGPSVSPGS
jgi:hypothetical protein